MCFGDLLASFLGMLKAMTFRDVCSTLIAVAAAVTTIMVAANNILDFIVKLNSLLAPKKQKNYVIGTSEDVTIKPTLHL